MASFEGLKNLAAAIAAVAVPVVVAWLGSHYTAAIKEREVSAKFVELAVQILSKEPNKTDDAGVRRWAIRVLDQYSGVEFDTKTREDIVNRVPLPRIIDTPFEGGSRSFPGMRVVNRIIVRDTQENDLQKELEGLRFGQVSYHYLLEKDSDVRRLKGENEIAYHTARFNENSIGIGILHVSGTGDYSEKQVESLTGLIGDIAKRHSVDRANIVGASEVDPKAKSDFAKIKARVVAQFTEQRC
jgi:hypothetical protein